MMELSDFYRSRASHNRCTAFSFVSPSIPCTHAAIPHIDMDAPIVESDAVKGQLLCIPLQLIGRVAMRIVWCLNIRCHAFDMGAVVYAAHRSVMSWAAVHAGDFQRAADILPELVQEFQKPWGHFGGSLGTALAMSLPSA